MEKKTKIFVGYDLGDGETMISILPSGSKEPESLRMPTKTQDGEPIITAFAYNVIDRQILIGNQILGKYELDKFGFFANFKEKPSSLLDELPKKWKNNLLTAASSGKLVKLYDQFEEESNGSSSFIMPWCVKEYTNAVFRDKNIVSALSGYADKCDEVTVFVGHPSKWDDLDIRLYRGMLERSVLGNSTIELGLKKVPLSFGLERESRAAFLFGRQKYGDNKGWEVGRYALTIDVGSSTTDCTAVNGLEVDSVNDGGDTVLGARLIDKAIYDYYRQSLKKSGQLESLDEEIKRNGTVERLCVLACRQAKEQYFSGDGNDVLRILAPGAIMNSVCDERLPTEEMKKILEIKMQALDDSSWKDRFKAVISDEKLTIEKSGHVIDKVVLTGGAARMDFVPDICKQVFSDVNVICDHSPGRTISHGLALVGRSNERSLEFQERVKHVLSTKLEKMIDERISMLSESISPIITDIVIDDIAYPELRSWRNGGYKTLNSAIAGIRRKCGEKDLAKRLGASKKYTDAINKWVEKDIMGAVGTKIQELCNEFGLTDLTPEFMDISNVSVEADNQIYRLKGQGIMEGVLDPGDIVAGIVGVVSGVVTFIVTPSIIAIVLSVLLPALASISTTIAGLVIGALGLIPGWGWVLLAAIAGVGVYQLVMNGWESMKDDISRKMMSYNLPIRARKLVSEGKLKSTLNESRSEVKEGIEVELSKQKTRKQISSEIAEAFKPPLEKKLREIRYIIESR